MPLSVYTPTSCATRRVMQRGRSVQNAIEVTTSTPVCRLGIAEGNGGVYI